MSTSAVILLVDDEIELIDFLKRALQLEGYTVYSTSDGFQALEVLETYPVDLVITDIAMPHMNGYQLYQQMMKNPQWVNIPCIFLSGRNLDSDIRFGRQLGVDAYLTKPVDLNDVLATVRGKLYRARTVADCLPPAPGDITGHDGTFESGCLRISYPSHEVWMNREPVKLSVREYALLKRLAVEFDRVVSVQKLAQATHQIATDDVDAGALLRPLIRSLRRKLGYPAGEMGCIQNIRGAGYKLSKSELQ